MKQARTAVCAYVPVLHKGYVDFFNANEGDIWIFGPELISAFVHLHRDIRAVDPAMMVDVHKIVVPGRSVSLLSPNDLATWPYETTVMPSDEVCHEIAKTHLREKEVHFVPVFLRWNRVISFTEFEVPPNRKITKEEFHKSMIDAAFVEAQKSSDWWRQIAAISVKEGKVLNAAHNHHLPTDFHLMANGDPRSNFDAGQHQNIFTSIHAEAEVIAKAARDGQSLKGTSLYTTTFPCPNCARLIGTAGIKTVYYSKGYSLLDAEKILDHFGVEVVLVE